MSEFIEITGGRPLSGEVRVGGAKNGVLPMLPAALLTSEQVIYDNVPNLSDINLSIHLLEEFGAEIEYIPGRVAVRIPSLLATEARYTLVKALRASFWVLGPLLARGGAARVALPGGDIIGARPVDIHLEALGRLGAEIKVKGGVVYATAPRGLRGSDIHFRFPSVGATHQIIMAASLAKGETVISGAACEPEVTALAELINEMGGSVEGAGSETIRILGVEMLGGARVSILGDRIEAGTYLLAAAACGGEVTVRGVCPGHLGSLLQILEEMGVAVECGEDWVKVTRRGRLLPAAVVTAPFPGLATDLQAPLMAAMTLADGVSTIEETIFEGRFGHASELCRLGAQITVHDRIATVTGVERLTGAPVEALDIRAAAALVIASLAAEGTSQIYETHHLRRGYEYLEQKIARLGGQVAVRQADAEDFSFAGC